MQEDNQPKTKNIVTLHKYDTVYSADSVEWCPHEPHQNIFVCGNYQLTENKSTSTTRLGRILLFAFNKINLELLQTIDTAAVLDQKWCPTRVNDLILLGVVNAQRTLEVYSLKDNKLHILIKFSFPEEETETLILSLDWSTANLGSSEPHITCSDSKGNVHNLQLNNSELVLEKSWHGHEFQAWISAYYYWDANIIFSGGDDSVFLKFDRRCGDKAVAKNRSHDAGVTSIHSNKSSEFCVVSGSYDERVRLWDVRNFKNPKEEVKMPGPLWRLKWDPFFQKYLLAACMLGGVHIISNMEIVDSYYEHKNIAYGADWSFLEPQKVQNCSSESSVLFGSCSFYDHLLCVATVDLKF